MPAPVQDNPNLLQPEEHVLSTLEADGSRRWLKPKLSRGRFLVFRRFFGWLLILIFTVLPFLSINGYPPLLLDVVNRRFHIFGQTFLPTDTFLLALFMLTVFLSVFLITALFGRVWCGWACPQTVYLEFVYRPIERLFDGRVGRGGKPARPPAAWRTAAKYLLYLIISLHLAHVFLAYFVGVDQLFSWSLGSPLNHPFAFVIIFAATGLLMFNFGYFREQLCIIACPYGRFQSVMLDKASMIISYDPNRGEARGKLTGKKRRLFEEKNKPEAERTVGLDILQQAGDCIDCHECVTTCPTGIDIRDGLQLECIGCAQCIDACHTIMNKVGRPTGLIRYTSQNALEGSGKKLVRPRVVIYPLLVTVVFSAFLFVLVNQSSADVTLLRSLGQPYIILNDQRVQNTLRLKIVNRSDQPQTYRVEIESPDGVRIRMMDGPLPLQAGQTQTTPIQLAAPFEMFRAGRLDVTLVVRDESGLEHREQVQLKGPFQWPSEAQTPTPNPEGSEP
ncbi:MAG: cytochrome c oxidase accessory protein CcoG [Planctomycetota bacterium]